MNTQTQKLNTACIESGRKVQELLSNKQADSMIWHSFLTQNPCGMKPRKVP